MLRRKSERIQALVLEHRDLPRRVARAWFQHTYCEADREDLIAAGVMGLIGAAERFSSRKGSFRKYAWTKVTGAIQDHLRKLDPLSRDMRNHRKRIGRAFDELLGETASVPTSEQLAARMGLSVERLAEMRTKSRFPAFIELDKPVGDEHELSPHEYLPDHARPIDGVIGARLDVEEALKALDDGRRYAVEQHFFGDRGLKEIGMDLQVSESRVCQMVKEALRMMGEELAA